MSWSHTGKEEHKRLWKDEGGIGLIETLLAMLILTVGMAATLSLFALSVTQNHELGNVGSRTTTYAEAKMEELLAVPFSNTAMNTALWPTAAAGGSGLANGGGVDPATLVTNYVDYLDFQGTRTTATAVDANGQLRQFFVRQWFIQTDAGNVKTITVRVTARRSLGARTAPFSVLISYKYNAV